MKQKPALFISLFLTIFSLAVVSTVIAKATGLGVEPAAASSSENSVDPALIAREQEYQQVIAQANEQISALQQEVNALSTGGAASVADPALSVPELLSAEEALQIAMDAAVLGTTLDGTAELVDFEGQLAYEVPYLEGNIYVQAESGDVLFNGTIPLAPPQIDAAAAARIAADYMHRTDVYKVETSSLNGVEVFRVKFSNGDAVFVSPVGQLLMVRLADNGGAGFSDDDHGSYEDHEDHEEYEDDD